jgi:ABC-type glutathione transport system ATPase component
VRTWCSRVIWLDQGRIREDGPTDIVLDNYMKAMAPSTASPEAAAEAADTAVGAAAKGGNHAGTDPGGDPPGPGPGLLRAGADHG